MAVVSATNYSSGVVNFASGSETGTYTAADFTVTVGFVPKHFKITNVTDRITQEWHSGMNQGDFIETIAAGDRTLETDDQIIVHATDGTVAIDVSGGIQTDNDTVVWEAWG